MRFSVGATRVDLWVILGMCTQADTLTDFCVGQRITVRTDRFPLTRTGSMTYAYLGLATPVEPPWRDAVSFGPRNAFPQGVVFHAASARSLGPGRADVVH